jgi:hypothetical protein
MARRAKNPRLRYVLPMMGLLIGLVAVPIGFIPNRDLADYDRLVDENGVVVPAELTGGASVPVSGRRGGSYALCSSWRYEIDGQERFHTERNDCHADEADIDVGRAGEVVYDPDDLATVFVRSDDVRESLVEKGRTMRWFSIGGGVVLAASIVSLVLMRRNRSRARPR